jgi:hypothetical protein
MNMRPDASSHASTVALGDCSPKRRAQLRSSPPLSPRLKRNSSAYFVGVLCRRPGPAGTRFSERISGPARRSRAPHRRKGRALLAPGTSTILRVFLLGIVALSFAGAEEPRLEEYQVKAVFLFNFAKFVEWPTAAFKNSDDPFEICILGRNPFGSQLEDVVRGKTIGNRKFVVRTVSSAQQADMCHVIFVSGSEQKRLQSLMNDLKASGALTVGESPDFLDDGGVVNFKIKDARVRIEINPDRAERAQLHISSKLLSLAEVGKRRP